jgi:hypothetical protein
MHNNLNKCSLELITKNVMQNIPIRNIVPEIVLIVSCNGVTIKKVNKHTASPTKIYDIGSALCR